MSCPGKASKASSKDAWKEEVSMIVQIRVDDRLIHGQVALMWGKELNTKGILVANDHAAGDETQATTLLRESSPRSLTRMRTAAF